MPRYRLVLISAVALLLQTGAAELRLNADSSRLEQTVSEFVDSRKIVGAQILVGEADQVLVERYLGIRSIDDPTPIDAATQFCIGSCSKPFASAILLSLAEKERLPLESPISAWIPEFENARVEGSNTPAQAPNLLQLLAHRSGIYSQKRGMNRRQARWIRDFRLTLEDSVTGIATEKLLAHPGDEYAYSGAGYCVLGRVAEIATRSSFESLLQSEIAQPLGLGRTSYFPDPADPNIASGSVDGAINQATPHLSRPFNLPLVGGSLYSTARDSARFARMILQRGRFGRKEVLNLDTHTKFLSLPFYGQRYGLGWSVIQENKRPVQISHSGALASSRATIRIHMDTGRYAIVYYTLADPKDSSEIQQSVNRAIIRAVAP